MAHRRSLLPEHEARCRGREGGASTGHTKQVTESHIVCIVRETMHITIAIALAAGTAADLNSVRTKESIDVKLEKLEAKVGQLAGSSECDNSEYMYLGYMYNVYMYMYMW